MNVDKISEWQWQFERVRWKRDQAGDGDPCIVTVDGLYVGEAESVETAEYIVGLHNARFKPCTVCGGHHASALVQCRSDSKGAPGDDRPPGCGIPPRDA